MPTDWQRSPPLSANTGSRLKTGDIFIPRCIQKEAVNSWRAFFAARLATATVGSQAESSDCDVINLISFP